MSRHLEETPKTKFRKGREEEYKKNGQKTKIKAERNPNSRRGYDALEEEDGDGY
jgi:hypothetical protein